MKTKSHITLLTLFCLISCNTGIKPTWSEEFDQIDYNVWTKIDKGPSPWNNTMSTEDSLFDCENGILTLKGTMTPDSSVVTAGLKSKGKKSFGYGRIEIKAKMDGARGAWPALWLMPEETENFNYGEIDICERLHFEDSAYQTIHTAYNLQKEGDTFQKKFAKGKIAPNDFNVYALEHYPDSLRFFINDSLTLVYKKMSKAETGVEENMQWTFDRKFYLLIDMQLGGPWVGEPVLEDLPTAMYIDWIRFYEFTQF